MPRHRAKLDVVRRVFVLLLLLNAACSGGGDDAASTLPTSTTSSSSTTTTVPATTTTAPGTCPVPARAQPDPRRPRYILRVDVRPAEHRVTGDLVVRFTPDQITDRLVFRLWANGPRLAPIGSKLTVGEVRVGAHPVATQQPDATTLVVPLTSPVRAGETVEASVAWDLALPGPNNDRVAQVGDSIRLGSFFPILAWEPGVGWATEAPSTSFAEASVAPVADFDVSITVPAGLEVLASGVPDAGRTRWHAEAVRDVAISVGRFRLATAEAEGVRITVGAAPDVADDPGVYARKLASELRELAGMFGPYPGAVYTLSITPSLSGGIEYPTHVMQGPGTSGRTTTHELAHQWFYGLVGNNQGRDPWLDEGLATYAEGRAEGTLASLLRTPMPAVARGHLTSPMTYWDAHNASYYRGVYTQGAQAVASLGTADRVDCALRLYIARNAYRIARPADLVAALSTVFADTTKLAAFGVTSSP